MGAEVAVVGQRNFFFQIAQFCLQTLSFLRRYFETDLFVIEQVQCVALL